MNVPIAPMRRATRTSIAGVLIAAGVELACAQPATSAPAGYDVAARAAALPAPGVQLPTAPNTRNTVSVSDSSSLGRALSSSQRRIVCTAGSRFTEQVTITRPDTVLDMTGCSISTGAGANILGVRAPRVLVIGGIWDGGFEVSANDVQLRNTTFKGRAQGSSNQVMNAQRVLIEHSDVASEVPPPSAVVLWAQGSTDLVVANSSIRQLLPGQATIRTHATKVVVMDSFVSNPTHHTLRAHADGPAPSPYVVWARNVIQGGRIQAWGGPGDPLQVVDMWIVDNEFHFNATGLFINAPSTTRAVITGNKVYDDTGRFSWPSAPGWSVSGNQSAPYKAAAAWAPQ